MTIGSEIKGLVMGNLIHSTPTDGPSTGERFYEGELDGKAVMVYHTNGTPSNKCTTSVYYPSEVKSRFSWDWEYLDSFRPIKEWVREKT